MLSPTFVPPPHLGLVSLAPLVYFLLRRRHVLERPHVVQTVRQLDDHDAPVLRLAYKQGGRALFNSRDVLLAKELIALAQKARENRSAMRAASAAPMPVAMATPRPL